MKARRLPRDYKPAYLLGQILGGDYEIEIVTDSATKFRVIDRRAPPIEFFRADNATAEPRGTDVQLVPNMTETELRELADDIRARFEELRVLDEAHK